MTTTQTTLPYRLVEVSIADSFVTVPGTVIQYFWEFGAFINCTSNVAPVQPYYGINDGTLTVTGDIIASSLTTSGTSGTGDISGVNTLYTQKIITTGDVSVAGNLTVNTSGISTSNGATLALQASGNPISVYGTTTHFAPLNMTGGSSDINFTNERIKDYKGAIRGMFDAGELPQANIDLLNNEIYTGLSMGAILFI